MLPAWQGKARQTGRGKLYCFSFCYSANFKLVVGSWAVGIKCVIYFPAYSDLSRSCCLLLESSTNAAQSMPTHLAHAEISYKLCKLSLSIIYIVCYVGNFHLFACEPVCLCAYTCVCRCYSIQVHGKRAVLQFSYGSSIPEQSYGLSCVHSLQQADCLLDISIPSVPSQIIFVMLSSSQSLI